MALKLTEQINLRQGGIQGLGLPLEDVVFQAALNACLEFQMNEKVVDEMTSMKAQSYLNKMKSIIDKVYQSDQKTVVQLANLLIVGLGRTQYTYQQVQGANTDTVLGFIEAQMPNIIEKMALVNVDEKNEYEAL